MRMAKATRNDRRKRVVRLRPYPSDFDPARRSAAVACTSSDVYSSSTASSSSPNPNTVVNPCVLAPHRRAAVGVGDVGEQHRLGVGVRVADPEPAADGFFRRWRSLAALEHRPVDPVTRHQLLRLGRERLRLGVEGRGLGLGEQGADLVEDTLW